MTPHDGYITRIFHQLASTSFTLVPVYTSVVVESLFGNSKEVNRVVRKIVFFCRMISLIGNTALLR